MNNQFDTILLNGPRHSTVFKKFIKNPDILNAEIYDGDNMDLLPNNMFKNLLALSVMKLNNNTPYLFSIDYEFNDQNELYNKINARLYKHSIQLLNYNNKVLEFSLTNIFKVNNEIDIYKVSNTNSNILQNNILYEKYNFIENWNNNHIKIKIYLSDKGAKLIEKFIVKYSQ